MNYMYEYGIEDFLYSINRNYILNQPLRAEIVDEGIVVPYGSVYEKGVYDKDGGYVTLSADRCEMDTPTMCGFVQTDVVDYDVVYIGAFHTSHYGNFLFDYISRLWYAMANNNSRICYVYISQQLDLVFQSWSRNILSLLNIPYNRLMKVEKVTRFKKIIVPQLSFVNDCYAHKNYKMIFETLYRKLDVSNLPFYEKIYVTRTKLTKKKEIGEEIFEEFFKLNGYEVVSPEKLSFVEQTVIFRKCKIVASIEGTHAHNIMFKGCSGMPYQQIVLRKQSECMPRQIQMNQILGGKITWIDVWKEPFKNFPISHDRGPFLIEWNDNIERFAKDNNMMIPDDKYCHIWKNRIVYCWKCCIYWNKHKIKHLLNILKCI